MGEPSSEEGLILRIKFDPRPPKSFGELIAIPGKQERPGYPYEECPTRPEYPFLPDQPEE